jgi:hypothetical protein
MLYSQAHIRAPKSLDVITCYIRILVCRTVECVCVCVCVCVHIVRLKNGYGASISLSIIDHKEER